MSALVLSDRHSLTFLEIYAWISSTIFFYLLYLLSGAVSSKFSAPYRRIVQAKCTLKNNRQDVDWNTRVVSTIHAVVISAACVHTILYDRLYEDAPTGKYTIRTQAVLAVFLGYISYDLAVVLANYQYFRHAGGASAAAHHLLVLVSYSLGLSQRACHFYLLCFASTELTTPFINLRWFLYESGHKDGLAYKVNGFLMWLSFTIVRAAFCPYLLYHFLSNAESVYNYPFGSVFFISEVIGYIFAITLLNWYWWALITKGLLKVLLGGSAKNGQQLSKQPSRNGMEATKQLKEQ
mmetsp:Transcript_1315/g.2499  ORF Transcript_1315/g.2499 Transcript_1315/m.2499 type:complete len:293 (-) Transcript_1315:14-892(-)